MDPQKAAGALLAAASLALAAGASAETLAALATGDVPAVAQPSSPPVVQLSGLVDLATLQADDADGLSLRDRQGAGTNLQYAKLLLDLTPGPVGLHAELGFGRTAEALYLWSVDRLTHPGAARALSHFEQLYVTFALPGGATLDVGKYGAPIGFEALESRANAHLTGSLLYALLAPGSHAGARVAIPLSDELVLTAFWFNGWDSILYGGNDLRSAAAQLQWRPAPRVTLTANVMAGLEHPLPAPDAPVAARGLVELSAQFALTGTVSAALAVAGGKDDAGAGSSFGGVTGWVRWQPRPWLSGALRLEAYQDPQGFTSGAAQGLTSATATVEVKPDAKLALRAEARLDRAGQALPFDALRGRIDGGATFQVAALAEF